jgi:hypothetical protein
VKYVYLKLFGIEKFLHCDRPALRIYILFDVMLKHKNSVPQKVSRLSCLFLRHFFRKNASTQLENSHDAGADKFNLFSPFYIN